VLRNCEVGADVTRADEQSWCCTLCQIMASSGLNFKNASLGVVFGFLFGPAVDQVIEGSKYV
jgi:hypothetical protein